MTGGGTESPPEGKGRMGKARYKARPSVVVLALVATTLLPSVPLTPTLAATTIVSNNVDSQSTGALVPGTRANQFTGTSGSPRLSLQKTTYNSVPKALSVAISGRGTSYTYKQYSSGDTTGDLQFSLQLGRDFTLDSSGDDLILAQTVSSTSASAGTLNSILTQGRHIGLDYFDSSGTQHSLYGVKYPVSLGSWHTVELSETVGAGTGSLTLLVDGSTAVSHANLDTGSQGVTRFAVGDEFTTPTSTASRGASDPVVVAAGDIACDPGDPNYNGGTGTGISCMQLATSNELATAVAVLPLGDDQYNSGTLGMFQQVYDPTWGRYKRTT